MVVLSPHLFRPRHRDLALSDRRRLVDQIRHILVVQPLRRWGRGRKHAADYALEMAIGGWDEYDDPQPLKRTAHFRMGRLGPDVFGVHGYHEDTYEYSKPDDRGELRSPLTATVVHHAPETTIAYPHSPQFSGYGSMAQEREATADLRTPGPGGQGKLFGLASKPGRSVVDWLGGTKEGRPHAMTMLGIAANRTQRDFGRRLEPSDNLSPLSARFVGGLAKRGVLSSQVETQASNDIDFLPVANRTDPESTPIPTSEVRAGKRTARRLLRST